MLLLHHLEADIQRSQLSCAQLCPGALAALGRYVEALADAAGSLRAVGRCSSWNHENVGNGWVAGGCWDDDITSDDWDHS